MSARARWWDLLRPPAVGLTAVILSAMAAALVVGHLRLWRATADERAGQDFKIFLASMRQARAGESLYTPVPLPSRSGRTSTTQLNLNLPHTNLLVWPFVALPDRSAFIAWTCAGLALAVGASLASVRALGLRPPALLGLAVVVYLLAWSPSAAFSLTGQLSFVLMLPVTAAWLAYRQGRSAAAGAWLGLGAAMKPFLFIFVPYLALRRDARAIGAMAAVTAAAFAAGLAVFGADAYVEWASQLSKISWSAHYFNASIFGVLQRSLGRSAYAVIASAPWLVLPLAVVLSSLVAAATFRAVARPAPDSAGVDWAWSALLLAALLISPLGWNYYLWIALWPVASVIIAREPWRSPRRADRWLLAAGLGGWLWWGRMTLWGQPHALATLTFGSAYFWALLALWSWTLTAGAPALGMSGNARPAGPENS